MRELCHLHTKAGDSAIAWAALTTCDPPTWLRVCYEACQTGWSCVGCVKTVPHLPEIGCLLSDAE